MEIMATPSLKLVSTFKSMELVNRPGSLAEDIAASLPGTMPESEIWPKPSAGVSASEYAEVTKQFNLITKTDLALEHVEAYDRMANYTSVSRRLGEVEKRLLKLTAGNLRTETLRKLRKAGGYRDVGASLPVQLETDTANSRFANSLDLKSIVEMSAGILQERNLKFLQGKKINEARN